MTTERRQPREVDDKGRTGRELYRHLAEQIWSPERLAQEAAS